MKRFFIFLCFSSLLFSCEEKADTKTGMLVSHGWRISSVKQNGIKTDCSCLSDDCYIFKSAGTTEGSFTISLGSVNCSAEDPAAGSFWMSDEETIAIVINGMRIYYKIFISDESLILINDNNGIQMTYAYDPC